MFCCVITGCHEFPRLMSHPFTLLEEVIRGGHDCLLICRLDQAFEDLSLECVVHALLLNWSHFQRTASGEPYVVETIQAVDVKPLCKLLRFWRAVWMSTHLQPPKTDVICKFFCLLKVPSTNQNWSASFFLFFFCSSDVQGANF